MINKVLSAAMKSPVAICCNEEDPSLLHRLAIAASDSVFLSVHRCAAVAMGLAPDSSPVVPTSITTVAGTPCSTPNAPTCCCNMASLVQFNMVAPNTAVADAYAAAMPNNLTGPAMVQCLQVSVKPGHCIVCEKQLTMLKDVA